ncbi:MAG TPA: hypothetical protein PLY93_10410 [Turneriella sp.]|nr:hypothetical protein [Turneriella sp.]
MKKKVVKMKNGLLGRIVDWSRNIGALPMKLVFRISLVISLFAIVFFVSDIEAKSKKGKKKGSNIFPAQVVKNYFTASSQASFSPVKSKLKRAEAQMRQQITIGKKYTLAKHCIGTLDFSVSEQQYFSNILCTKNGEPSKKYDDYEYMAAQLIFESVPESAEELFGQDFRGIGGSTDIKYARFTFVLTTGFDWMTIQTATAKANLIQATPFKLDND